MSDFVLGRPLGQQREPEPESNFLAPSREQLDLINGTFDKTQYERRLFDQAEQRHREQNPDQFQQPAAPQHQQNDNTSKGPEPSPVMKEMDNALDNLINKFRKPQGTPVSNITAPQQPTEPATPQNESTQPNEPGFSLYEMLTKQTSDKQEVSSAPAQDTVTEPQQPGYTEQDLAAIESIIATQKQSAANIEQVFVKAQQRGMSADEVYEVASSMSPDTFLDYVQYLKHNRSRPKPPVTIANTGTNRNVQMPQGEEVVGYRQASGLRI